MLQKLRYKGFTLFSGDCHNKPDLPDLPGSFFARGPICPRA
jgi:hypothetical protein